MIWYHDCHGESKLELLNKYRTSEVGVYIWKREEACLEQSDLANGRK